MLLVLSNNTPPLRKSEIEYYAMLAKCAVLHYAGNNPSVLWPVSPEPLSFAAIPCPILSCCYPAMLLSPVL